MERKEKGQIEVVHICLTLRSARDEGKEKLEGIKQSQLRRSE